MLSAFGMFALKMRADRAASPSQIRLATTKIDETHHQCPCVFGSYLFWTKGPEGERDAASGPNGLSNGSGVPW